MPRTYSKHIFSLVFIGILAGISESQELLPERNAALWDEVPEPAAVTVRSTDAPLLWQAVATSDRLCRIVPLENETRLSFP